MLKSSSDFFIQRIMIYCNLLFTVPNWKIKGKKSSNQVTKNNSSSRNSIEQFTQPGITLKPRNLQNNCKLSKKGVIPSSLNSKKIIKPVENEGLLKYYQRKKVNTMNVCIY